MGLARFGKLISLEESIYCDSVRSWLDSISTLEAPALELFGYLFSRLICLDYKWTHVSCTYTDNYQA